MVLKPWEVKTLGLGRTAIDNHVGKVPDPGFGPNRDSGFMHALAEAALAELLGLGFDGFMAGLERARKLNAALVMTTPIGEIAVSALMSKLKSPNLDRKTVVVPAARVDIAEAMETPHAIVAGFVQESDLGRDDRVPVAVAGWIWADEVEAKAMARKPFKFKTKIPVHLVACSDLRPIDTLIALGRPV